MTAYNARSTEEVRQIVENFGYTLLNEYQSDGRRIKRVVIQDDDGYKYDVYLNSLMSERKPNFVDIHNPFTLSHNIPLWLKKENKLFVLSENNVYKGAEGVLFFQCLREECQEIFDINWAHIYRGQECPFCVGKRVGRYNNLSYRRPDLAREWDYEKNEKTPEDYTYGSNKKVSWICSKCGHPWDAFINNRSSGKDCPKCAELQKESTIANELKIYFKERYNAIPEYKIFKNPDTNRWLPYDIYIPYGENPELSGFYIEIHDNQHYKFVSYWHKTEYGFKYQKRKDGLKKKFARKNGMYIEVDLRKIKTTEEATEHIEKIMQKTLSK